MVGTDASVNPARRDRELRSSSSACDPARPILHAWCEDAFAFLLEREPRESILHSFDLPVIGRYFPEWESEMGTYGR